MKYFLTKLTGRMRRLGAVLLVFGGAGLVLAYFLGFYDIAFLDREKLLGSIATPSSSIHETQPPTTVPDTTDPALLESEMDVDLDPDDDAQDDMDGMTYETQPGQTSTVQKQSRSVCHVIDPDTLSEKVKSISNVSNLLTRGYSKTTADYDSDTMRLGKMQFTYALPKSYSLHTRQVEQLTYVYPENFTEYYAAYTTVTEPRPAIELYMGYILYDNGKQLILIDGDGTVLQGIDDTVTIPAGERDKNDMPLFYRWSWNGSEKVKIYYRLSDDGKSFVLSDHDPVVDGRGLTFDYPASYGRSDGGFSRVEEAEEAVTARLTEEAERVAAMTEEERTAEEEQRKLDKTVVFNAYEKKRIGYLKNGVKLTDFQFRQALPFYDGYAAVVGDENRQEMYFLASNGRKALSGYKMYLKKDYERYVIESWRLPASYGIESIGSFYFDHGWVRVRRQIIDNYAYMTYDNVRVISDTDILVDKEGNVFPIPAGYTLRGYSGGMLLLEKDGRYGFMDYTGAWIAQPIYAAATPFVSGLATLTTPDGRVGMIDTEGNIVLSFAYEAITQSSSGLVAAYHAESGWVVYQVLAKG